MVRSRAQWRIEDFEDFEELDEEWADPGEEERIRRRVRIREGESSRRPTKRNKPRRQPPPHKQHEI